jgi:hypothetical protein
MRQSALMFVLFIGLVGCASGGNQSGPLTGSVERVWEDGFRINSGSRAVRVDAFAVCGDSTAQAITVGDEITVEGNPGPREFDATAITNAAGEALCAAGSATPGGTPAAGEVAGEATPDANAGTVAQAGTLTGSVERVWEDGFQLNTSDGSTRVDAWEVCGDGTAQSIAVGDDLTVAGNSSALEFDATAITNAAGEAVCP